MTMNVESNKHKMPFLVSFHLGNISWVPPTYLEIFCYIFM